MFTNLTELGCILKEVSLTFFNLFLTLILTKTHSNVSFLFSDILCKVIFRNITLRTNRWINHGTNMADSLYTLCDIVPSMSCMLYFRLLLRISDDWCRKTFLYLEVFLEMKCHHDFLREYSQQKKKSPLSSPPPKIRPAKRQI